MYFPLEKLYDGNKVIFYEGKYFDGKQQWEDTLLLKGILLEKRREQFNISQNIYSYFFEINPFFLNQNDELLSTQGNIIIGETIELNLNLYERSIEGCQ